MQQAVMIAPGRIEFRRVAVPTAQPGEVLIHIRRIGVCGSDIHVFHGLHPYTSYPVVQGHEVAGLVAQVGAQVEGFTPGETVVFLPQITCGVCYPCRHGMGHICDQLKVMGFQADGAAQEYFAVPAEKLVRVPTAISLDQAAMIEPLAVAVHALGRAGDVRGKKLVVLGAGTIGSLTAQAALALGAEKVLITDISETRLAMARACGLSAAYNSLHTPLAQAVAAEFGADQADIILECVGAQETIHQAVAAARKGSTIIVVGVYGEKPQVDLGLVQDRELTLAGTLMYQRADYESAMRLLEQGLLHPERMITHRFAFQDYLQAYRRIDELKGESLKVMIDMP